MDDPVTDQPSGDSRCFRKGNSQGSQCIERRAGLLGLVLLCTTGFFLLVALLLWCGPYVVRWQIRRMKEILKDL